MVLVLCGVYLVIDPLLPVLRGNQLDTAIMVFHNNAPGTGSDHCYLIPGVSAETSINVR